MGEKGSEACPIDLTDDELPRKKQKLKRQSSTKEKKRSSKNELKKLSDRLQDLEGKMRNMQHGRDGENKLLVQENIISDIRNKCQNLENRLRSLEGCLHRLAQVFVNNRLDGGLHAEATLNVEADNEVHPPSDSEVLNNTHWSNGISTLDFGVSANNLLSESKLDTDKQKVDGVYRIASQKDTGPSEVVNNLVLSQQPCKHQRGENVTLANCSRVAQNNHDASILANELVLVKGNSKEPREEYVSTINHSVAVQNNHGPMVTGIPLLERLSKQRRGVNFTSAHHSQAAEDMDGPSRRSGEIISTECHFKHQGEKATTPANYLVTTQSNHDCAKSSNKASMIEQQPRKERITAAQSNQCQSKAANKSFMIEEHSKHQSNGIVMAVNHSGSCDIATAEIPRPCGDKSCKHDDNGQGRNFFNSNQIEGANIESTEELDVKPELPLRREINLLRDDQGRIIMILHSAMKKINKNSPRILAVAGMYLNNQLHNEHIFESDHSMKDVKVEAGIRAALFGIETIKSLYSNSLDQVCVMIISSSQYLAQQMKSGKFYPNFYFCCSCKNHDCEHSEKRWASEESFGKIFRHILPKLMISMKLLRVHWCKLDQVSPEEKKFVDNYKAVVDTMLDVHLQSRKKQ